MGVVRVQDGQRDGLGPGGPGYQTDEEKGREEKDPARSFERVYESL